LEAACMMTTNIVKGCLWGSKVWKLLDRIDGVRGIRSNFVWGGQICIGRHPQRVTARTNTMSASSQLCTVKKLVRDNRRKPTAPLLWGGNERPISADQTGRVHVNSNDT